MFAFTFLYTAAQMWNLAINFPLMIGDKIPSRDEKWECFLFLLDILQLCTTRIASEDHAGILEALIHDHHHLPPMECEGVIYKIPCHDCDQVYIGETTDHKNKGTPKALQVWRYR